MDIKHGLKTLLTIALLGMLPPSASGSSQTTGTETKHAVLIHGAYHGAWCWYKVSALLRKEGYTVAALDLTSQGINKAIADDVTSIAQYAQPVVEYLDNVTGKVVVVGHSLGGVLLSYLMERYGPDKISKAIFLASVMPKNNESFISSLPSGFSAFPPDGQLVRSANKLGPTSLSFNQSYSQQIFYNLSPWEDIVLANTLLVPTPYAVLVESLHLTPGRYGAVGRYFILTDDDMAIVATVQKMIIAANPPERVFPLKRSDHSAFFSQPLALTKLIQLIDCL